MIAAFFGESKFRLGALFVSDAASRKITLADLSTALSRHAKCDWGGIDRENRKRNAQGMLRVISLYGARNGTRFHVLTEPKKLKTSVFLPKEV